MAIATGPLQSIYFKELLAMSTLLLLFMLTAIGVIFTKHIGRALQAELQTLNIEQKQLDTAWGQLTLEKATWLSDLRVEQIVNQQLQMVMPKKIEMITP